MDNKSYFKKEKNAAMQNYVDFNGIKNSKKDW